MTCARYDCGWTGLACMAQNCPRNPPAPAFIGPMPSPRTMPVNIPFSMFGITVVTMDHNGNITVKVDQPYPDPVGSGKVP